MTKNLEGIVNENRNFNLHKFVKYSYCALSATTFGLPQSINIIRRVNKRLHEDTNYQSLVDKDPSLMVGDVIEISIGGIFFVGSCFASYLFYSNLLRYFK